MPDTGGILTYLGGAGGFAVIGFVLNSLRAKIDDKADKGVCEERHMEIKDRLEKVDLIYEAVIRMDERQKIQGGRD